MTVSLCLCVSFFVKQDAWSVPWPSSAQIDCLVCSDHIFHAPWCLPLGLASVNAVVASMLSGIKRHNLPLQGSQAGLCCVTGPLLSLEVQFQDMSLVYGTSLPSLLLSAPTGCVFHCGGWQGSAVRMGYCRDGTWPRIMCSTLVNQHL